MTTGGGVAAGGAAVELALPASIRCYRFLRLAAVHESARKRQY